MGNVLHEVPLIARSKVDGSGQLHGSATLATVEMSKARTASQNKSTNREGSKCVPTSDPTSEVVLPECSSARTHVCSPSRASSATQVASASKSRAFNAKQEEWIILSIMGDCRSRRRSWAAANLAN